MSNDTGGDLQIKTTALVDSKKSNLKDDKYSSSLLDLPNELITTIADFCDEKDLPNLRLACKAICQTINTTFVSRIFRERRHVMSSHSLSALEEITAHPIFGPRVKTVVLSSLCRSWSELVEKLEHREHLRKILSNIKKHGTVLTIGVSECDGHGEYFGWTKLQDNSDALIYDSAEILADILFVNENVRCPIGEMKMFCHTPIRSRRNHWYRHFHLDNFASLGPQITLEVAVGNEIETKVLRYNGREDSLEIKGFSIEPNWDLGWHALVLSLITNHLSQRAIREIRIEDSEVYSSGSFWDTVVKEQARSLESIHFSNVTLMTRRHWYAHLLSLSDLPGLKRCRLNQLCSTLPARKENKWDREIVINRLTHGGDTDTISLFAEGNDLSSKLREAAAVCLEDMESTIDRAMQEERDLEAFEERESVDGEVSGLNADGTEPTIEAVFMWEDDGEEL